MPVAHLLRSKGDQVVTIAPDATVAVTVAALGEHRIGALVVSEDGRHIAGIVSERDVVAALASRGAVVLDEVVASIMTKDVVTCEPGTTVDELMAWMTERRIRHVPVVLDGELAGIISIGDVVKDRISELETETQTLHEYITGGR